MRCKHEKSISDCNPCLSKILTHLLKSSDCYANAFINLPIASSTVVRTFTQEEITDQQVECLTIPLTSSCSGSYFQLSSCKSPKDNWCKVIDQANNYITSLQVPKCCNGCYNFDLSASVALTSTFTLTVTVTPTSPVRILSYDINLPVKATLKLSEQMPRDICVADEVSETSKACFTAVTFPIIDTPMASAVLGDNFLPSLSDIRFIILSSQIAFLTRNLLNQTPGFVNLSCSGTVCLKGCQRLVPTLTLSPFIVTSIFDQIPGATFDLTFTNTKLLLSDLSLKLVKIGSCTEKCRCKKA